jgi:hypothetical protein
MITENSGTSDAGPLPPPPTRPDTNRSGGSIQPMPSPYGKGSKQ